MKVYVPGCVNVIFPDGGSGVVESRSIAPTLAKPLPWLVLVSVIVPGGSLG